MQSSNKDYYVLDCFAGSGTTLKMANKLDRKWIGVDISDVAIDVIKSGKLGNYIYYDISNNIQEYVKNITHKQITWDFIDIINKDD